VRKKRIQRQPTVGAKFRALPESKQALLLGLLEDLDLVRKGGVHMADGTILYMGFGIPLPQTPFSEFVLKLLASPDDWRKILANEILLLLERLKAFPEAAPDAWQWCKKYRLDVKGWIRDAPEVNRQGKRPPSVKLRETTKKFLRTLAVRESAEDIATEKQAPGYRRDPRRRDKFARAKELLDGPLRVLGAGTPSEDSTKGIEKSYREYMDSGCPCYINTTSLMGLFRRQAPTLFKLLS
jgi:hypothetical protein